MSDYTKTTNFTAKDSLSTGDPLKLIKGSYFDTEFDNIATAVATKYDSGDLASQAQAEAGSGGVNTVLMTPVGTGYWADAGGAGIVGELWDLTDPGADRILFWDDGEAADSNVAWLTVSNGLEIATSTLGIADAAAGAGLTASSGVLAVGAGNGLTVNANDVAITDQAASTTVPVSLTSGTLGFDITALTDFGTTAGVDLDADTLILSDGPGTNKEVLASQLVTPELGVTVSAATDTLAETDFGKVTLYSGATCTVTLPNGLKAGFWATLIYTGTPGAGLVLSATTTLNTANSLTTCTTQYGMVTVFHAGSNVWYAWGQLDS